MLATVQTVAFQGIDVRPVEVQVQLSSGLVAFTIVGLPDKAVGESRERVRAALQSLGLSLPAKRLTVNLAPADLLKEGSHYDLPIALAVLAAMEVLPREDLENTFVLGELGLDASIRAVSGVLPAALFASTHQARLICPHACGAEAAWAGTKSILAPADVLQIINHYKGIQVLSTPEARVADSVSHKIRPDLAQVRGQETARRALEITAAGGHNLLMMGPPGSGKSLLASCLPSILPPLSAREALEVSTIHSLAGQLPEGGLITHRPFRDPHHSASLPALIGGGHRVKPGEISLAHQGVLFLDELPEFARPTLEALRQPLETGETLIARVNSHVRYPARFQLVAAMNPCRCGYLGDSSRECTKAPKCGSEYQEKISGPMFDRIDLHVDVPAVSISDLGMPASGESSAAVSQRVARSRDIQLARFQALSLDHFTTNAQTDGTTLETIAPLEPEARTLLNRMAETAGLSARAYFRILRVARTIADLDDATPSLRPAHIAEALSFRRLIFT
jgi:magnesium chelatase family protein